MSTIIRIGEAIVIVTLINILWMAGEAALRRRRARLFVEEGPDWVAMIQAAAEVHFEKVNNAYGLEEEAGTDADVDNPAWAPYCGCTICIVREVLAGAWPVISHMVTHVRDYDLDLDAITPTWRPHD